MSFSESDARVETVGMAASPYVRQNRSSSLNLTTTFQRLDFNGTSTRNTNTFPTMPGETNPIVKWDATNKVFQFNSDSLHHYDVLFNFRITSSGLISALNLNTTSVKLRFVVPSPTPRYFPLPDDGEFVDIARTNLTADIRSTYNYIVRSAADVRVYGIGIDLAIGTSSLLPGTVTLTSGDISIYGR